MFMKERRRLSPSASRTPNREWVTPLKKRSEQLRQYPRP